MRHDVESVDTVAVRQHQMRVRPRAPISMESKPQQTGTGLLIRQGEVATTSDSTNSLDVRLKETRHQPVKLEEAGASPVTSAIAG